MSDNTGVERVMSLLRDRIAQQQTRVMAELGVGFSPLHFEAPAAAVTFDPARTEWSLGELLAVYDKPFVTRAYLAILRRDPDAEGLGTRLEALRTGAMTRVELLFRLRYGAEGKDKAVRITGLWPAFLVDRACRLPVLGFIPRYLRALRYLPQLQQDIQDIKSQIAMNKCDADDRFRAIVEFQNHHLEELYRRQSRRFAQH